MSTLFIVCWLSIGWIFNANARAYLWREYKILRSKDQWYKDLAIGSFMSLFGPIAFVNFLVFGYEPTWTEFVFRVKAPEWLPEEDLGADRSHWWRYLKEGDIDCTPSRTPWK